VKAAAGQLSSQAALSPPAPSEVARWVVFGLDAGRDEARALDKAMNQGNPHAD
jgi:hypothetical protein